jgi:hypothetical protein
MSIARRRLILLMLWSIVLFLAMSIQGPVLRASESDQTLPGHHEDMLRTVEDPQTDHHSESGHGLTDQGGHHGHEDLGPKSCRCGAASPLPACCLSIALFPLLAPGVLAPPFRQGVSLLGGGDGRPVPIRLQGRPPCMKSSISYPGGLCALSLFCCGPCIPFQAASFAERGRCGEHRWSMCVILIVGHPAGLLDGHHRSCHAADPAISYGPTITVRTAPSWWSFFIFLVANIGGSLTPLGDPPLFLGFLHGVSFFWTFANPASHGDRRYGDCCWWSIFFWIFTITGKETKSAFLRTNADEKIHP